MSVKSLAIDIIGSMVVGLLAYFLIAFVLNAIGLG